VNSKDPVGSDTLSVISKASKFNYWMYQTITPLLEGKILEVGSGIGNITQFFKSNRKNITPSDFSEEYVSYLHKIFNDKSAFKLDLTDVDFTEKNPQLKHSFDSAFALNVIEHIENDSLAIKNMAKLIKANGTIVILVPAYQSLYCQFDKNLGHYKRYTEKTLSQTVEKAGLKVDKSFYFNATGILGWLLFGKILNKKQIGNEMGLYNKLVPIFKVIDKLLFNKVGLSVVAVIKVK